MEVIDKLNNTVQQIQKDLDNVKDNILSKEKRKEKVEEIRQRAEKAKQELEEKMSTLKDEAREKAQALLDSLNNLINVKLSILSDNSDTTSTTGTSSWDSSDKWWFFRKTKAWVSDQRNDIFSKDKRKEEKGKNILRTAWFAATWVWLFALAYKWVKSIFWKEAREERRKRRDEKRAEKQRKREEENAKKEKEREERRKEIEELPFWDRPIGKFLKWTWIGTLVVWWVYALKRKIEKWKEDSPESKMKVLYWFEDKCKWLKEWANQCLKSSHTYVVDYAKNKEEYDEILAKAKTIKNDSKTIFDEIKASNASDKVKKQAERIESNINKYVEEIEAMKDEIYATLPDWVDVWNGWNWWWSSDSWSWTSTEWEWTSGGWTSVEWWEVCPEKFEPVSADVLTKAAMDYLDVVKGEIPVSIPRWSDIKSKAKAVFDAYFKEHSILKKSESKKMVFEIDDPVAFWNMFKEVFDKAVPNSIKRLIPSEFKNKINNISNTLKNADVKTYEDIVFKHFWTLIGNAVRAEDWTMTVQTYYDSIKKSYPNKNISQIDSHLVSSGQAGKDIKDLTYPLT